MIAERNNMSISINLPEYATEKAEWVSTIVGEKIIFVTIRYDSDSPNPLEEMSGEGEIYSLGHRHINYNPDKVQDAVENNLDAVKLSYYEHGGCRWSVQENVLPGEEFVFDGVKFAGVWIPDEDALDNIRAILSDPKHGWHEGKEPDRQNVLRRYADDVCETYTQWCNGEVYGFQVEIYNLRRDEEGNPWDAYEDYRREEPIDEDSCWGFYGYDCVEGEVKDAVEALLK